VGLASTGSGLGYWLVAADGGVFAFGDAPFHGSTGSMRLVSPVLSLASTRTNAGYWLVANDGGVFAFGDARFHGSTGSIALNQPIVGMASTPTGQGYWLVASDGGVFAYGDARFLGSTGSLTLNEPVVGMVATGSGRGYWLVASDGGVFAFGDAPFLGVDLSGAGSVVDLAPAPGGSGYWVASDDGTVHSAGTAPRLSGALPDGRVTAIVAAPGSAGYWLVGTGALQLPGGGTRIFEGGRRLVAHYGSPGVAALGVLGETGPDEAVARIRQRAEQWVTPGVTVLPTMEIIATVANSFPTANGDYSTPVDIGLVRQWVDVAEREGVYVILDIQPGRSDFLTEARRWEELLARPHVGLALDPEWRMGPTQVPAQVIGSVTAAEVNAVSAWLDDLVVRNGLPEKLFVVHQFRLDMIRDRASIVDRPNLAENLHADGFGTPSQKLDTWNAIRLGAPWTMGFKLFIDEDRPRMMTVDEVLALSPDVRLITYQ
jgi:hypothetical protein